MHHVFLLCWNEHVMIMNIIAHRTCKKRQGVYAYKVQVKAAKNH